MRAITEKIIREEIKCDIPEVYYIPTGCILTPAAREFLQQEKIRIAREGEVVHPKREISDEAKANSFQAITPSYKSLSGAEQPVAQQPKHQFQTSAQAAQLPVSGEAKYVDFETGAYYTEKPEYMTQLTGNMLVRKNHPRILLRGKLDSVQSLVVFAQSMISQFGEQNVVDELSTVLNSLREVMRAEVLDDSLHDIKVLGLTHEELREQSHNPQKYFGVRQCKLPDYAIGQSYALLNMIRANIREAEVAATTAFTEGTKILRPDIIEQLNRLSSAMHIMMCKYDAGMYKASKVESKE